MREEEETEGEGQKTREVCSARLRCPRSPNKARVSSADHPAAMIHTLPRELYLSRDNTPRPTISKWIHLDLDRNHLSRWIRPMRIACAFVKRCE